MNYQEVIEYIETDEKALPEIKEKALLYFTDTNDSFKMEWEEIDIKIIPITVDMPTEAKYTILGYVVECFYSGVMIIVDVIGTV